MARVKSLEHLTKKAEVDKAFNRLLSRPPAKSNDEIINKISLEAIKHYRLKGK